MDLLSQCSTTTHSQKFGDQWRPLLISSLWKMPAIPTPVLCVFGQGFPVVIWASLIINNLKRSQVACLVWVHVGRESLLVLFEAFTDVDRVHSIIWVWNHFLLCKCMMMWTICWWKQPDIEDLPGKNATNISAPARRDEFANWPAYETEKGVPCYFCYLRLAKAKYLAKSAFSKHVSRHARTAKVSCPISSCLQLFCDPSSVELHIQRDHPENGILILFLNFVSTLIISIIVFF